MCRKFIFLFSALVLSFACISYADEILIGDFEQSMEGWGPTWETPAPTLSYSTIGATLGQNSLCITPGKNGWQWMIMHEGIVDIVTYDTLSVDVTWVAAEWGTTSWCNFKEVAVNSDGTSGWKQYTPTDVVNPNSPGGWDPVNWGDQTRTLTWDFYGYDATGATFMQIVFSQNFAGETPGNFYIDNVRLIASGREPPPPPAPPSPPPADPNLLGDFEGALDGWTGAWAGTEDLGNSTVGATLNSQSMSVKVGTGEFWKLQRDGQLYLAGATAITADVTFIASEWPDPNTWLNVNKIALQDHTGWAWQEVSLPAMKVTKICTSVAEPPAPDADGNIAWWKPDMGDATWTISWSLEGMTLTDDVYSLFMSLQNPNIAKGSAGLIYIDNVRVVHTKTIVLADFEQAMDNVGTAWEGTTSFEFSTTGATLGNNSLAVKTAGGYWVLQRDGVLDLSGAKLEIDVTFLAGEWPENAWLKLDKLAVNSDLGWREFASSARDRCTNADVNEDWKLSEGDVQRTYQWDLSTIDWTGTITWMQIIFSLQQPNVAFDAAGNFYLDNMRLIVPAIPPPKPAHIIWVSDAHQTIPGVAAPDDQGWVDMLTAAGFNVEYRAPVSAGVGAFQVLDADEIADLEDADLIIFSRDTSSTGYNSDVNERTFWNGLNTPLICLQTYLMRSNRWQWFNTTSLGERQSYFTAQAVDPTHPIFNSVNLDADSQVQYMDPDVYPGSLSFVNFADAGNGTVIAIRPDTGNPLIVEWQPDSPFYPSSPQTPGGKRIFFTAGTQEESGTNIGYGIYNLSAEGQKMFLNAVDYMLRE